MAEELINSNLKKHYFVTRKRLQRTDVENPHLNIFLIPQVSNEQELEAPSALYHILGDSKFK